MGAGTRAVSDGPRHDLRPDRAVRRRTRPATCSAAGRVERPDAEVLHLDIAAGRSLSTLAPTTARSRALLGDALAAHDVTRSVVGNADLGLETAAQLRFRRPAGALGHDGRGRSPLRRRVAADRVLRDGSDRAVGRRARRGTRASRSSRHCGTRPGRRVTARRGVGPESGGRVRIVGVAGRGRDASVAPALESTDATRRRAARRRRPGTRCGDVDRARRPQSADTDLSAVALTAPGLEPGLLESATTRRTGFVQLADVAPTVLDLFGLDDTGRDGRPAVPARGERGHVRRPRRPASSTAPAKRSCATAPSRTRPRPGARRHPPRLRVPLPRSAPEPCCSAPCRRRPSPCSPSFPRPTRAHCASVQNGVRARGLDPRPGGPADRRARGAASPASVPRGAAALVDHLRPCSRSTCCRARASS